MKKAIKWFLVALWLWVVWYLTQYPNLVLTPSSFWDTVIADGSHFVFFGTLAFLFYLALPKKIYTFRSTVTAVFLTSLYGVITEIHQHFVPGRTMDPADWTLDTLGAMLCIWIVTKIATRKV